MNLNKKTPRSFSHAQYIDCVLYLSANQNIDVRNENDLISTLKLMFSFYYRNHLTSVYGKQTDAEEIFHQPIIKQRSRADSSSLGIDMSWSFDVHSLSKI